MEWLDKTSLWTAAVGSLVGSAWTPSGITLHLDVSGTWNVGFRPTQVRLTFTGAEAEGLSVYVRDAATNTLNSTTQLWTGFDVDSDLSIAADIVDIICLAGDSFTVTKIEFYGEDVVAEEETETEWTTNMGKQILFRRGAVANLPNLEAGEPGWSTDTKALYVGDGVGAPNLVGSTISPFMATVLDDANAAAVFSTLGLDANIATLDIPASATISDFAKTFLDDTSAAAVRTTIGVAADAGVIYVTDYGAVGDGVTDDYAALQDAFDAGTVIVFPQGKTFYTTDTITATGKRVIVGNGSTVLESTNLSSIIAISSGDETDVDGLNFIGTETSALFAPLSAAITEVDYAALRITASHRSVVNNVRGSSKRCLVYLDSSNDCKITNWSHVGFFGAYSGSALVGSNYCAAVYLKGGNRNTVSHGNVTNHGTAVLMGSPNLRTLVSHVHGDNLKDDGVYGSTADYSIVEFCSFKDLVTAGVEMRGSFNSVRNNTITNANVGIVLTGRGAPTSNVNGLCNSVSDNQLISCRTDGVQVLGVDTGDGTGYISGLAIEGNTFYSCPSSASVGHSIDVQAANNISVNNNQVMNGLANSTTISIQAVASATPAEIVNVCNNTVFECTGIGIFVQWATLGNVSGNAGHGNGSQLIEGRYCSSMNFIGNACTDQAVVVLTDTYTNTGNVIGANIGAYSVSQNVVNGCLILPSFSQTALFPAPSSIPVGTLSTTVSATTVYVATALTSAGNWTAVN